MMQIWALFGWYYNQVYGMFETMRRRMQIERLRRALSSFFICLYIVARMALMRCGSFIDADDELSNDIGWCPGEWFA